MIVMNLAPHPTHGLTPEELALVDITAQRAETIRHIAANVAARAGLPDITAPEASSQLFTAWMIAACRGFSSREIASVFGATEASVSAGIREAIGTTSGVSAAQIIATTAAEFDVTVDEIKGSSRVRRITVARQEAMSRLSKHGMSLNQIGRIFARDHTTVLHGIRRARGQI